MGRNMLTLDEMSKMTIAEVSRLDVEVLATLLEESKSLSRKSKMYTDWLLAALGMRYNADALGGGTTHVPDEKYDVAVTVTKKVEWHQGLLAELFKAGVPYVTAKYTISEKAFAELTGPDRAAMEAARTVSHGRPTFAFKGVA